jgi:hypothetical protein
MLAIWFSRERPDTIEECDSTFRDGEKRASAEQPQGVPTKGMSSILVEAIRQVQSKFWRFRADHSKARKGDSRDTAKPAISTFRSTSQEGRKHLLLGC